jgi:hypothetical protein
MKNETPPWSAHVTGDVVTRVDRVLVLCPPDQLRQLIVPLVGRV